MIVILEIISIHSYPHNFPLTTAQIKQSLNYVDIFFLNRNQFINLLDLDTNTQSPHAYTNMHAHTHALTHPTHEHARAYSLQYNFV